MIWRFKTCVVTSSCLILLSLTLFERNIDVKGLSQLTYMSYVGVPREENENNLSPFGEMNIQEHKNTNLELIHNGIFWSNYAESFVPKGDYFFPLSLLRFADGCK